MDISHEAQSKSAPPKNRILILVVEAVDPFHQHVRGLCFWVALAAAGYIVRSEGVDRQRALRLVLVTEGGHGYDMESGVLMRRKWG